MKITYTGIKQELSAKLQAKLDAKFAKLSKLLEKRGEIEAHVVVTVVRHLHKAEITVPFYEHKLIGVGSDRGCVHGRQHGARKAGGAGGQEPAANGARSIAARTSSPPRKPRRARQLRRSRLQPKHLLR